MHFILTIDNGRSRIDVDYAPDPEGLDYGKAYHHREWAVSVCKGSPHDRTNRTVIARVSLSKATTWAVRSDVMTDVREALVILSARGYFENPELFLDIRR